MEPRAIAELMRNEHPQIIAIVLAHLDPDQAAEVLKCLPDRACAPTCCCASPRSTASSRMR